jgi:hypothetical protein
MNPVSGKSYDVAFVWERPPKARSFDYDLWIALDSDFKEKAAKLSITSSSSAPDKVVGPGAPGDYQLEYMPGTTYYWKIRTAQNGPLKSPWSEVRSFTTEALEVAVMVPTLMSPANGATSVGLIPAFSWGPVDGATKYEFALAAAPTAKSFGSPIASASVAETGVRPLVKLDYGRTYFWRVRVSSPEAGEWSTIANFTTESEAPPPPPPPAPPVVVKEYPPAPAQPPPQITLPQPQVIIPPAPAPVTYPPAYIWAIIIIGAVLVIAVIVLIVRTRRPL